MRSALTLLMVVLMTAASGCRQPAEKSSTPPATPRAGTVSDANVKALEGAVSNALEPLRPGDCAPGTGQHQMAGVKPLAPGVRPKPCEPTPQLFAREPARAKALAATAERMKHPQP
jgi:hypothetical protein